MRIRLRRPRLNLAYILVLIILVSFATITFLSITNENKLDEELQIRKRESVDGLRNSGLLAPDDSNGNAILNKLEYVSMALL